MLSLLRSGIVCLPLGSLHLSTLQARILNKDDIRPTLAKPPLAAFQHQSAVAGVCGDRTAAKHKCRDDWLHGVLTSQALDHVYNRVAGDAQNLKSQLVRLVCLGCWVGRRRGKSAVHNERA